MRIYLDACALNRLFDERTQSRVRVEAEAMEGFFVFLLAGQVEWISSEVLEVELGNNPAEAIRKETAKILSAATERIILPDATFQRAEFLKHLGYGPYDALHLACAEQAGADVLLTTDDRFLRQAQRGLGRPSVRLQNPVNWIEEFGK